MNLKAANLFAKSSNDQQRRILTAAAQQLEELRKAEGKMFPASDAEVLNIIRRMQFEDTSLI